MDIERFDRPPDKVTDQCSVWKEGRTLVRIILRDDGTSLEHWVQAHNGTPKPGLDGLEKGYLYDHREDGPARIERDENGTVIKREFYLYSFRKSFTHTLERFPQHKKSLLKWI